MDTAERDDRVMTIAAEALQKPLTERESFLRAACQNDPDLYQEVSEVVTWEERTSTFLRRPLIDLVDIDSLGKPFEPHQKVAGRFDIIREIGDGGMGVVYEAYDNTRGRRIAIKCAKPGFSRLQSPELNGALKVRHPNVCQLNDIHMASTDLGEVRFITMELLDGETLLSRLSRGRLDPDEAMKIARQLCAGLAEAHRCGVVHGDFKPANIILARGAKNETRAVITDFGLAANQDADTVLLGGTPSYMAPELKKGGRVSPASDVYALGVVLYEMIAGQKPFPQELSANAIENRASENKPSENNGGIPQPNTIQPVKQPLERPGRLVKHLPQIWDDAILPCLAPLAEKRPSAAQVTAVLEREPVYRRPWFSQVAIAALVIVAVGAFLWRPVYNYFRAPDITLAILPTQGSADMQSLGDGILRAVEARLAQEPNGPRKVRLLSPDVAQKKGVSADLQAKDQLHATHVLELTLSRDANGIAANAYVADLKAASHLRDYAASFAESDKGVLSDALASLVSTSLHLPRAATPETIAPAAKAAYDKGNQYLEQDNPSYDAAIAEFQKAAKLDPHSALPLAGLTDAYILNRRAIRSLAPARESLGAAMRLNPDSPRVLLASSSLNTLDRDRSAQAVQDSARALELEPENAEAWVRLGFAKEIQDVPDQAQAAYHKAIELAPNYYKPYKYLGAFYYYSQPDYAQAEKFYGKAREVAPGRLEGYATLGALLTVQARYAEAEKIYREAISIQETPENLNNLGATLAFEKHDKEAISCYERAIRLQPIDFYYINLGDAQRRLGDAKDASANYQKALALSTAQLLTNPASGLARAYMAYSLARLHKNNAELEIGEAVASAKGDQQILLFAVLTYEVLGKRSMALDIARKVSPDIKKELQHYPGLADFNQ